MRQRSSGKSDEDVVDDVFCPASISRQYRSQTDQGRPLRPVDVFDRCGGHHSSIGDLDQTIRDHRHSAYTSQSGKTLHQPCLDGRRLVRLRSAAMSCVRQVRASENGRSEARTQGGCLGPPGGMPQQLGPAACDPEEMDLAELLALPGMREECVLRSNVGFMALHAGSQDRGTQQIAQRAAERAGASYYAIVHPPTLPRPLDLSAARPCPLDPVTGLFGARPDRHLCPWIRARRIRTLVRS